MIRTCNTCHIPKPIEDFYKSKRKNRPEGERAHQCKECTKERVKRYKRENQDRERNNHLRRAYGISLADYKRMLNEQDGKCACCGTEEAGGKHGTWNVDHDHITGDVRQLLCKDCNIVLGIVQDSPEHLERLIAYILKHKDG